MKKYTILALALALCVTGLTGCRRNNGLADGTIPSTTAATAPETHATTMPTTAATTVPTTIPATTEDNPNSSDATNDGMNDTTAPSGKSRSHSAMPGVG